jgi:hypothetical protein
VQVRERKLKIVDGKIEVPDKKVMEEKTIMAAFKSCGAEDYIELDDNIDFDLKKTIKRMMAQMKAPAPVNPNGILERLKKETRLAALNLAEREEQRRDAIDENNADAEEDEEIEIETFDEYEEIILPCFVELAKAAPQREKLSSTIKELRAQMGQREDETDMKLRELTAKLADRDERIMILAKQVSEERCLRQAAEAHLKEKGEEVPDAEPDTIQHLGGNNYSQWSLPFQG